MKRTHFIPVILASLLALFLSACTETPRDPNTLVIGTISGPETDLMYASKEIALKEHGITLEIIEFEDYITPNMALADGALDANIYQHEPYLEMAIAARGYPLVNVARTFVFPMGMYSQKHTMLDALPTGATIGIPNDPSNGARALLLLEQGGLITVEGGSFQITQKNIIENPKKLKFQELEAALLPRSLEDLDAAVINTTFIIPAGLSPRDALLRENSASPYANIVVTREDNQNSSQIRALIESIQNPEVVSAADELFDGMAIPAWRTPSFPS